MTAVLIYIHTNSAPGFSFLHILNNTCYFFFFLFMITILTGMRDITLWFWFAFPWWLVMLSTFSCNCWSFVHILWKNVYSFSLPIFNRVGFAIEIYEFIYIRYQSLIRYMICKYLYHFIGCFFTLQMIFFVMRKLFSLM